MPARPRRRGAEDRRDARRPRDAGCTRTASTRRSGSTPSRAGPKTSGAWSRPASTRCGAAAGTSTARVADMDLDGVYATLCFPSLIAGFAGTIFAKSKDQELGLAAVRAWNDWHIEEWAGTHPDRVIPLQLTWVNDPEVAAAEIRANAERGFKAVTFPENPVDLEVAADARQALGPVPARVRRDRDGRVPAQRVVAVDGGPLAGRAARAVHEPLPGERAGDRGRLAVGAGADAFPNIKIAFSEGGISWVPMLIDRIEYVLDHSAVGSTRVGRPERVADRRAAPKLLVLHDRLSARRSHCATTSASTTSASRATSRTPTRPGPTRSRCARRARRVARRRRPQGHVGERLEAVPPSGAQRIAKAVSVDLLIRDGTVVDGTGAPARRADVGVTDGRVVAIGPVDDAATRTIDADGLVVAPGFVDLHTHYDAQLLWDPTASPSPLHGVTTVFGGNCGFALAPGGDAHVDYLSRLMARVEGIPLPALQQGVPWDWTTFAEYVDRVEQSGISGERRFPLRAFGVAARRDGRPRSRRRPRPTTQLAAMEHLLHDALAAGAMGFSSSQAPTHNDGDGNPVPSRAATRDEMLRLAAAVRAHPGTQLELIIPGCLNGFTDDEVALMAAMSAAADRPLNWNVLGVATGGNHDQQLAAGTGRPTSAAAWWRSRCRRACGSVFHSLPDSCSTGSRAGERRSRCRSKSGCRRSPIPPPVPGSTSRRALARSRRACEPRALGATRDRRRVHAADATVRGPQDRRHRDASRTRTPFDALLRHRRGRRAAYRSAARLRRTRARRRVEDARRGVARPAR